jgi:hypothetical protein
MRGQLRGQQLIYRANAGQHPVFGELQHNAASMVSALLTLPVLQRGSAACGQRGVWHLSLVLVPLSVTEVNL